MVSSIAGVVRESGRQCGSTRIVPEDGDSRPVSRGLLSRQLKGTYIGFLKGYINTLYPSKSSTAPPANSKSNSKLESKQAFGAFDSLGISPSDLDPPKPRTEFNDHYQYFANVHKDHTERLRNLNEQSAKVRRTRAIFSRSATPNSRSKTPTSQAERSESVSPTHAGDCLEDEPDLEEKESRVRSSITKMRWAALKDAVPEIKAKEAETPSAKDPKSPASKYKPEAGKKEKNSGLMRALELIQKRDQKKREACDSIRFLIFGCLGNEHMPVKEKHTIYEQTRGTREDVFQLYNIWSQMDEDGSGDVEYQEFLNFFSKNKADRLLGMRCVKFLVGGAKDQPPDGEDTTNTGCTIEDMIKLIWIEAKGEDVQIMLKWFREAAFHQKRVSTPPLLPKRKRRELIENFRWLDRAGTGKITYSDLVDCGLVDAETAQDLMRKYDNDGSGDLDAQEFLELLCPNGYRAHDGVREAVSRDGEQLTFVCNSFFNGWTVEGAFETIPAQFLEPMESNPWNPRNPEHRHSIARNSTR